MELADLKAVRAKARHAGADDDGDGQSVRQRKVAADVQRCLVQIALRDLAAIPILDRSWTVNAVHMSPDLSVAKVFWASTLPLSDDHEASAQRRARLRAARPKAGH